MEYFVLCGIAAGEERADRYTQTYHHDVTAPLTGIDLARFTFRMQSVTLSMRLYPRVFAITPYCAAKVTAMLVGRFFNSELIKMLNDAKYLESAVGELDKLVDCRPNRLCLLAALNDGPPEDRQQLIQELMLGQISMHYPDFAYNILENVRFNFEESELVELIRNDPNEFETVIHVQCAIIKHQLGSEPLTVDVLDRASTRNRNIIVGACIFTRVKSMYPNMADRIIDEITMRCDNSELVAILNDERLLEAKIVAVKREMMFRSPLNELALIRIAPEDQKSVIGNCLFPLVHDVQPVLSAKITGMLLELSVDELMRILRDDTYRESIIEEAVATLTAHKERKKAVRKRGAEEARLSEDQSSEQR